jgi:hypothetical protein
VSEATVDRGAQARSVVPVLVVTGALLALAVGVATGASLRATSAAAVLVTVVALARPSNIRWSRLVAALILVILFIPIRRYTLPGNLPVQLEPYRIFVILLVGGWAASLLVDPRVRLRKTGFEGPIALIVAAAFASILANGDRIALYSTEVQKALMFFFSFLLVVYLITSVIRRLDAIDYLAKALVTGGAVVAAFAILEARTGINVFNHLDRVLPGLTLGDPEPGGFQKFGTASMRVFASAQHPIALSAALVMLAPLAVYLTYRYRQRRWLVCAVLLAAGCASTVSRTGIVMFVVVGLVFLWLRPREMKRLWPALLIAPVVVHFALPGTIGALKHSFLPAGGLIAEQQSMPGEGGSGRLADIGPALEEWKREPLVGSGFGTRVIEGQSLGPKANVLDNQWLGTLIETGAIGIFGWIWLLVRAVRRFGAEAKRDESARGWLLAALAAGIAAYAVGMLTFDAFSFIQVTFLLFIFIGIGAAAAAERPLAARVQQSPTT